MLICQKLRSFKEGVPMQTLQTKAIQVKGLKKK